MAVVHEKRVRKPRHIRLPDIRSDDDCRRLIAALRKPVYRGCFTLVYAYGLRIGEAITLPVTAVDSRQSLLRVIGKGNKERALPLTLGFWALTIYGIGDILGAGIYALTGKVAGEAGPASWLAFLVAMFVAGLTGASYAELVSATPDTQETIRQRRTPRLLTMLP